MKFFDGECFVFEWDDEAEGGFFVSVSHGHMCVFINYI